MPDLFPSYQISRQGLRWNNIPTSGSICTSIQRWAKAECFRKSHPCMFVQLDFQTFITEHSTTSAWKCCKTHTRYSPIRPGLISDLKTQLFLPQGPGKTYCNHVLKWKTIFFALSLLKNWIYFAQILPKKKKIPCDRNQACKTSVQKESRRQSKHVKSGGCKGNCLATLTFVFAVIILSH